MKSSISILVFLFCCAISKAEQLKREVGSPDGRFLAVITYSDTVPFAQLTIQDRSGRSLFSSAGYPEASTASDFDGNYAHWSPDGEILALNCGFGQYSETHLFLHQKDDFVLLVPPDLTNGAEHADIYPLKWLSGHRLILDLSWPNHGHPRVHFKGRTTLRVFIHPSHCEVLYRHVTRELIYTQPPNHALQRTAG